MTSKLPLIPIRLAVAEPIIVLIDSIRESATIASYAVLIISLFNVWLGGLGDSWLQMIRDILPHDVGAVPVQLEWRTETLVPSGAMEMAVPEKEQGGL